MNFIVSITKHQHAQVKTFKGIIQLKIHVVNFFVFLLWNTKEDTLKNVSVFFFLLFFQTMNVSGVHCCLDTNNIQNIFCVLQKKVSRIQSNIKCISISSVLWVSDTFFAFHLFYQSSPGLTDSLKHIWVIWGLKSADFKGSTIMCQWAPLPSHFLPSDQIHQSGKALSWANGNLQIIPNIKTEPFHL